MKVSELLAILQNKDYADFEVELSVTEPNTEGAVFPTITTYTIDDIADVGYSSKVVLLSGIEK